MTIENIPAARAAGDAARSMDALADVLMNATLQSLRLSEKLVKVNTAIKVGDPNLGRQIDTSA
jgi:hypothetical protein